MRWCTSQIHIRTRYILKCDGFPAFPVVKGDDYFIIIQEDGVNEGIYQHFPVFLFGDVQGAELM